MSDTNEAGNRGSEEFYFSTLMKCWDISNVLAGRARITAELKAPPRSKKKKKKEKEKINKKSPNVVCYTIWKEKTRLILNSTKEP